MKVLKILQFPLEFNKIKVYSRHLVKIYKITSMAITGFYLLKATIVLQNPV